MYTKFELLFINFSSSLIVELGTMQFNFACEEMGILRKASLCESVAAQINLL